MPASNKTAQFLFLPFLFLSPQGLVTLAPLVIYSWFYIEQLVEHRFFINLFCCS